jgi:uracil-DNA glycosylase
MVLAIAETEGTDLVRRREQSVSGRYEGMPFLTGIPTTVPRLRSLPALNSAMCDCTRCALAEGRTRVVSGVGPRSARVFFLGEAPGAREDEAGEPFVGAAGRLFDRMLAMAGVRRHDVYVTNVVACRPPGNRAPRPVEIRAHAPWLEEQIRLVRPEIIATLGRTALTYFVPHAKITELTGLPRSLVWQERIFTLLPLFHPAAALRSPDRLPLLEAGFGVLRRLLEDDSAPQQAVATTGTAHPIHTSDSDSSRLLRPGGPAPIPAPGAGR